jgi:transcriptional regulator GlxA family with amidase domain
MKHLSILVPAGNAILDTVLSTYNLFRMANSLFKKSKGNGKELFNIDLVGLNMDPVTYDDFFQVKPTATIEDINQTDLIIVSAISGNIRKELDKNMGFIPWIRKHRIEGDAEVASLCKGAVILAETGLLNGKSCATHWTIHNTFRQMYPKVNLVPEKIIIEDNGIYSSGGAYSFLNFDLYLIEKFYGREIAIQCSKISEIEFDRMNQGQFMIFNGQKGHKDEEIKIAQSYIEENFELKLNIEDIAGHVAISTRSFLRRFKKATANTPTEYIQRVKVEAAKKKLESTLLHINEVMYHVGYIDDKAFRNVFRKYTGLSPLDYRTKYNREMVLAS